MYINVRQVIFPPIPVANIANVHIWANHNYKALVFSYDIGREGVIPWTSSKRVGVVIFLSGPLREQSEVGAYILEATPTTLPASYREDEEFPV